ncbi:MAG TPA: methylated-DNA--[protein]-cysteine S-methyltransferase [Flavobacteriaceae bacterium]|nr:methylated-DNA--[protein]-cysteine S-methyltransferase [Flavobacteriaceae bacterium]
MEFKQLAYYNTPIGTAKITGSSKGICSVSVIDLYIENSIEVSHHLKPCINQLEAYFNGTLKVFNLKLDLQGTAFQCKVWNQLQTINYGKTTTYLNQAKNLHNVKAIRAVAAANGKNPLWIVVPCHRVIGSDGSLTGYAGGIWRKKWLINHESNTPQQSLF